MSTIKIGYIYLTMSAHLINKIRELIEENNLSVQGLEKKSGLKIHAVRNILTGKVKRPSAETLQAIATTLGCSIAELMGEMIPDSVIDPYQEILNHSVENHELFRAVVNFLLKTYSEKKKSIKIGEFMKLSWDIYDYSLQNNKGMLDEGFAKWLYSKV